MNEKGSLLKVGCLGPHQQDHIAVEELELEFLANLVL